MDKKQKVPVAELKLGMYVSELDRPWLESPFTFQGFPLKTADDIEAVRQHCRYVIVDLEKSSHQRRGQGGPHRAASVSSQQTNRSPLKLGRFGRFLSGLVSKEKREQRSLAEQVNASLDATRKTFKATGKLVRDAMDDVRLGQGIDTPAAKEAVADCVDKVISQPNAMMLLTSIKEKDAYTSEHSLNVAVLSIVLGRKLGLPREKLEELGLCGLLHDIGKVLTPDEVLNKPGRLTPEELLIMKMHPVQGRDILLSSEGVGQGALDVAHGHHERLDGSGYPRGLSEDGLSLYTRIVAVVDTFDAITSDRVYGNGRTNVEAFKILQSCGGNLYDSHLVSEFIDTLGVYTPGSVAELSNGEIAVVVSANPEMKLRPVVLVLKDRDMKPVPPRYLDLSKLKDSNKGKLHIKRILRARDVGVDSHVFNDRKFLATLEE